MIKRGMAVVLIGCLLWEMVFCTACFRISRGSVTVLSQDDEQMVELQSLSAGRGELSGNRYRAYLEAVLTEGETIVAEQRGCTVTEAQRYLLQSGSIITTAFNGAVYEAVNSAYKALACESLAFGCAVTDMQGNLLTLHSAAGDENAFYNHATEKTPPYSSFKPLCVYTPALESGKAVWSSAFLDAPIKKITGKNGKQSDWPANANGSYSLQNTSLAYALKTSLNTVAVRCMQTVTVERSLQFMENAWGLVLPYEKEKEKAMGEEEVIGNVALGYLNGGISPLDMAGYYQVFANGGIYIRPHTVLKIVDESGNILYEYQPETRQAIKASTAYIMNHLLQNVLSPGGTGEKATCDGIPVGGKTGTGDAGNWFVGFTPNYSCAVWHGTTLKTNHACTVFANAVSAFPDGEKKTYPTCAGIEKAVYCCESGMLFSDKCRKADLGYYTSETMPGVCNIHIG